MMKMKTLLSLSLESASRSTGTNSSPESKMFSSESLERVNAEFLAYPLVNMKVTANMEFTAYSYGIHSSCGMYSLPHNIKFTANVEFLAYPLISYYGSHS